MSQLAKIVQSQGVTVSGSDLAIGGHNQKNIQGVDAVVYTSAIGDDNVELKAAKAQKILTIQRGELLGSISKGYKNVIAVAGAHGKTTTTTILGAMLQCKNPTIHVGGQSVGQGGNCIGGKEFFVTEACEYKRNFLHLKPTVGIVLNIALDHTDYYTDQNDIEQAYVSFAQNCQTVIVDVSVKNKMSTCTNIVTVGCGGDFCATNIEQKEMSIEFDVLKHGEYFGTFELYMFGLHNVQNALFGIATCDMFGLTNKEIAQGLKSYSGVRRRFEIVSKNNKHGIVVSDYAHHPDEIALTIKTARQLAKHVRVIFEPHTYSRTKSLKAEFVNALKLADIVALLPIYPAREEFDSTISSDMLAKILNCTCLKDIQTIKNFIFGGTQDSVTIVMGAGPIDEYVR